MSVAILSVMQTPALLRFTAQQLDMKQQKAYTLGIVPATYTDPTGQVQQTRLFAPLDVWIGRQDMVGVTSPATVKVGGTHGDLTNAVALTAGVRLQRLPLLVTGQPDLPFVLPGDTLSLTVTVAGAASGNYLMFAFMLGTLF